ncbi:MAG: MEDS domain-containing protein [Acidobacteriota bacterium]
MNTFYNSHTNTIPTGEIAGTDWADMNGRAHFVQFYQDDETIINAVAGYFVHGLRFGEICIMVATHEHTQAIGDRMHEWDPSVGTALAENRLIILDAHETLGKFMVNGMPDPQLFEDVVGGLLEKVASSGRSLRAFGELVAILAGEGNAAAAVELEVLWNKLAEEHHFRLFCAFPGRSLTGEDAATNAAAICSSHSHILGSEAIPSFVSQMHSR